MGFSGFVRRLVSKQFQFPKLCVFNFVPSVLTPDDGQSPTTFFFQLTVIHHRQNPTEFNSINIKFKEIPFSGFLAVACGQTYTMKLIGAFLSSYFETSKSEDGALSICLTLCFFPLVRCGYRLQTTVKVHSTFITVSSIGQHDSTKNLPPSESSGEGQLSCLYTETTGFKT
jgi:hypothetical protein